MRFKTLSFSVTAAVLGSVVALPQAKACGGLFCSAVQPVNQAAERIVFATNADDTVTAVIEIQYQGPSSSFSWLLPIGAVPDDLKVSSNQAFQRLQAATNPQYTLTTRTEGTCKEEDRALFGSAASAPGSDSFDDGIAADPRGSVTVEASGNVGPFDWTVLSVADGVAEPAQVAVDWLEEAGYDVPDSTTGLLGPYLTDGLYLLALKLTKGADAGSIRPIVVTYPGTTPSIPIRPTSVAANPDMGVMTWLLGQGRGVPTNYLSLELNEARINWFNPNSNYNAVVIEAADDAGGQGFVTEYSQEAQSLSGVVWTAYEESAWQQLQNTSFETFADIFDQVNSNWGSYDGYLDALEQGVTLSASVSREDFRACPSCYADEVEFTPSELIAALEQHVIEPMRVIQDLLDKAPDVTRLYTTLSADEMTIDPAFAFNTELPSLSNVHTAERVIECADGTLFEDAPFRIELPQGGVVRGRASDVGSWPAELASLPANRLVSKQGSSGKGRVAEDNRDAIEEGLSKHNATVPGPREAGFFECAVTRHGGTSSAGVWLAVAGVLTALGSRRWRRSSWNVTA